MKKGDRVIINTKFGGMYCGKMGTVQHITTTDRNKANNEWTRYSPECDGWYEVWFDYPLIILGGTIPCDIFKPEELQIVKGE